MRKTLFGLPLIVILLVAPPAYAVNGAWTGALSAAPADAKDGVVAILTVKEGAKETVFNVRADGDVAKSLKEMAAKGIKVTVTGSKIDDATLSVSKVEKAE